MASSKGSFVPRYPLIVNASPDFAWARASVQPQASAYMDNSSASNVDTKGLIFASRSFLPLQEQGLVRHRHHQYDCASSSDAADAHHLHRAVHHPVTVEQDAPIIHQGFAIHGKVAFQQLVKILGLCFEGIRSMSLVLFTRNTVLQLVVIALLPVAPLLLTMQKG
jgi:hypothetical protein